MKILIAGNEKVFVANGESRTVRRQHVSSDFAHVKERREKVAPVFRTKRPRFVQREPGRSGRTQMSEHRHEARTGPLVLVDGSVVLAVDSPVDGMNEAVAPSAAGTLQKSRREDALAARRENHLHWIVH